MPIKRLHKMSVEQARKEMAAVGLVWKETKSFLPNSIFSFARNQNRRCVTPEAPLERAIEIISEKTS